VPPSATPTDYCQWEQLNASCPAGHVIMMESARFGRMRLGRCIDTDVFIGCSADVLTLLDTRCSGRPACRLALPDPALHQQQACPKDLVAYLEASYSCIDGQYTHLSPSPLPNPHTPSRCCLSLDGTDRTLIRRSVSPTDPTDSANPPPSGTRHVMRYSHVTRYSPLD